MIVATGEVEILEYMSRIAYNNPNNAMLIDRQLLYMNEKLFELQNKIILMLEASRPK